MQAYFLAASSAPWTDWTTRNAVSAQIGFYVAISGLVFTAVVLASEAWGLHAARRRRGRDSQRTILDEVRELRELGATIDAQATDLNKRLEALERTLVRPKARPEPVAPRSA